ncbi:hypothetical protein BHE74_00010927 [Ensete ventricosum]|nr:hypothetical protein GW17_00036698 [Ensete ventricosum]RWW80713.1 hypothetical protein BHE74_00010927 [Ensete ventricosum]
MRSTIVNKMSEKLRILHELRRCNLERQPGKGATRRDLKMPKAHLDILEASLEELYQGQRKLFRVESSQ